MKTVNFIATGALGLLFIVTLGACSKTKNSTASTNNNCAISYDGQYRNPSTGQLCAGGSTSVCTNGFYTSTTGQVVTCQIGQPINTGYNQFYPQPTGYGQSAYPTGAGSCQQYNVQYAAYGVTYVPYAINGQYQCVRYDLISQYAQQYMPNTGYASYGADYYYAYPPSSSNSGWSVYLEGIGGFSTGGGGYGY